MSIEAHTDATLMAQASWGDVPGWISAAGTIVALVAAAWAGLTAKRLYDREAERDERAASAARREQARRIAAWLEPLPNAADGLALYVRNGSSEPVYNFQATLIYRDQDDQFQTILPRLGWSTVPPKDHPVVHELPPAELVTSSRPGGKGPLCVAIAFVDAAGIHWHRDHLGRLVEGQAALSSAATNPAGH